MSGPNNPYSGSFGGGLHGTVNLGGQPASAGPAASGDLVKDTTTAAFGRDVIEESQRQPVLVDFWAPWCGPCRQLAPAIEKVVREAAGKVKLVKLNIDDHPSIPGQLGIQSIPAVIAFAGGRPVDGFMGAIPESEIRQFIDKLAGPGGADDAQAEIDAALDEAQTLLDAGDINAAGQLFGAVLQHAPENPRAIAGIARCMIEAGQHERARDLLGNLPEETAKDDGIQAVLKQLAQIEEARKLGDPAALEHALALDPDDHESRIKLAKIRNVEGKREEAAEHLLLIMRKDRAYGDDAGRKELVQFFETWGPKDPATVAARRKMSSILFS
ncbi:thioredoxin [Rhizobiaceae bacterium BDR2-2]|uniref:Thioredoxin n=1 Tax=Ectorhizobium quercum TaxID=2965071 RepID=A0AAE3N2C8_9HYPH|nr:thioredoxin [Ectorhizobium quercum]MCX8999289.1 thioredoxin [Ectorhizobium quercum]